MRVAKAIILVGVVAFALQFAYVSCKVAKICLDRQERVNHVK